MAAAAGPVPRERDLAPHVWPSNVSLADDGALVAAGVDVREIARTYDTPAFVLDEADLRARARLFRDAFGAAFAEVGAEVDVFYAGKSFLSVAVARWVREEGLRVDTCSGGELAVALRAGVPGPEIGLHGNNKSDDEIRRAVEARVGRIVVDSPAEIERVAAIASAEGRTAADPVPVMVRVTTGIHAGGHEFISTAHEDQKFGIPLAQGHALAALRAVLGHPELELLGAHSHIGSQIQDAAAFEAAARAMLGLRADLAGATGVLVPEVDLGGGYGIAYTADETPIDVRGVARALARTVAEVCAELGTPVPRISVEPGRAVVGPAAFTLYRVGVVKPVTVTAPDGGTFVRTYVSVDGGMSDNIRPVLYGATYTGRLANRAGSDAVVRARVVGKHCESGDIVLPDVELPADVAPGDLLAVAATGAYGRSMASNYNHLLRPPVLAVRDGQARVLVRRETEEDLLALDVG
ncbi:diaminopimelate decarboxylase [Cellulomonas sp. PhB143]|uniref:diaminopimelate decarboxylase n=1 Tax=Cellulomonas sp. PhB143 TaxID=2485186 RepID=UPI00351A7999